MIASLQSIALSRRRPSATERATYVDPSVHAANRLLHRWVCAHAALVVDSVNVMRRATPNCALGEKPRTQIGQIHICSQQLRPLSASLRPNAVGSTRRRSDSLWPEALVCSRSTSWFAFGSSYLQGCMTCACGEILSDTCDKGRGRASAFDPHVGPPAKVTTRLSPQTLLVSARQIALRQQACSRSLEATQLSDSRPTDTRAGPNPPSTLPDAPLLEA